MKIGICGAGIGGLTAAAALAQDGHNVVVYDQFDQPGPVGSGLMIQPVGQRVLKQIGADRIAFDLGQTLHHMVGHEVDSGRRVLDVGYATPKRARSGLGLHRSALFEAVCEAARASGAVLEPGHKVIGVTEAPDRRILFKGGRTSPPFDLIVDASGARSPLSPLQSRALPFGAVWGTVDWPDQTDLPINQLSQAYRAANKMAGVLPVGRLPGQPGNKAAVFWSLARGDFETFCAQPIDAWKEEACTLWPKMEPFLRPIGSHEEMTTAFYSHGTLWRPIAPGLAIIGDAAHRTSPQLGQGANMAMLDAAALVHALKTNSDLGEALSQYTKLRRWHLWSYQTLSAAFTPLYQSHTRILPGLRDHVLTPLSRIPPFPRILTRLVCGDLVRPFKGW